MADSSRLNNKNNPLLRVFLPILFSLLMIAIPIGTRLAFLGLDQEIPALNQGNLDLSEHKQLFYHNYFLRGQVEFFYNEWIVSEPNDDASFVYIPTPSPWTGKTDANGNTMSASGFGSYRYLISGLTPGARVYADANLNIPNRIYLNRFLCSQNGNPSKQNQSTLVPAKPSISTYVEVPLDGVVEYVMEVGNTNMGGTYYLGTVIGVDNTAAKAFPRILSLLTVGVILSSIGVGVILMFLAQNRLRHACLIGAAAANVALYAVSRDSVLGNFNYVFSMRLSEVFSAGFFVIMTIMLLLYGYFSRSRALKRSEIITVNAILIASMFGFGILSGTGYEWIPFIFILACTFVGEVRFIYLVYHRQLNYAFLSLWSFLLGYGVVLLGSFAGLFDTYLQQIPTIFAAFFVITFLGIGFYDVHQESLIQKDKAVVERRFRLVSNRALVRVSTDKETLWTLSEIGNAYRADFKEGDRKLVFFSGLLRKRLLALREETITFENECDLESKFFRLRNANIHAPATLLLGFDDGDMKVPPLLFEEAILEIIHGFKNEGIVSLEETNHVITLTYPSDISLSETVISNARERATVSGFVIHFEPGKIILESEANSRE